MSKKKNQFDLLPEQERAEVLARVYGSADWAHRFLNKAGWPQMVTKDYTQKQQGEEREYKAEVMAHLEQLAVYDPYGV